MSTTFQANKLAAAVAVALSAAPLMASAATGPSSSQSPYLLPVAPGYSVTSILTTGDSVGGYQMAGIPDGLGAYDNNDGTFTVLMNHEIGNTLGTTRAHGGIGAYVSQWVVNKSSLAVQSGHDLIQNVYGWDKANQISNVAPSVAVAFGRFCSADLPVASGLYNAASGLGSQAKIFMNGEEGTATGWVQATVVTGTSAGNSYTLGKFNLATNSATSTSTAVGGWENALVNPFAQDKTVVIGTNDGGTGIMSNSLAVYVGTKTNAGSEVDKAGLTNGALKFINVAGNAAEIANSTTRATNIADGTRFTLGDAASTTFSRPEDGAWNPSNPNQFFFATTDRLDQVQDGTGTQIGHTRLWSLTFDDITNPDAGGKIDLLVEGGTGNSANMWDNLTVDKNGHIILQEDVGNAAHNGKVYDFDPATETLTQILKHDPSRFGDVGLAATAPFTQDEESSGVIDVTDLFDNTGASGSYYLLATQAHYPTGNPTTVEGGQLQLVHVAPVPVPAAVWLFGSALAGFAGLRRRKA